MGLENFKKSSRQKHITDHMVRIIQIDNVLRYNLKIFAFCVTFPNLVD